MLDVLLESRHVRPPRPVVATVISAVVHAALFGALVGGTAAVAANDDVNEYWDKLARLMLPPDAPPTVGGEHVAFVAMADRGSPKGEIAGEAEIVKDDASVGEAVVPRKVSLAVELDGTMQLARAAQSVGAFTIIDVDSVAERDPLSAAPVYPKVMLERAVEGSATLRFVIDSTGLVDLSTIRVMSSTHQEFAIAVREAMPRMRYRPATRGATAVRQLVEKAFKFELGRMTPAPRGVKPR